MSTTELVTRNIPAGIPAFPHAPADFRIDHYLEALDDGLIGGLAADEVSPTAFNLTAISIHSANVNAGWWTDLDTGAPKARNVPELLCLVHSEISEGLEGHRKGLNDDHLPHRPMIEVELADAMIRIFDLAGALQLDLGGAIVEKLAYNASRADHKIENRLKADGKKI